MKQELIDLYTELHKKSPVYGKTATYSRMIYNMCEDHKCKTVLDYGCGKGMLANVLCNMGLEADKYDPAIAEFSTLPEKGYDMVVANDVLEHLSPEDYVEDIDKMVSRAKIILFFNISCRPAVFHLPNGENCHTLVRPPEWWIGLFSEYKCFDVILSDYRPANKNLVLVLKRKQDDE